MQKTAIKLEFPNFCFSGIHIKCIFCNNQDPFNTLDIDECLEQPGLCGSNADCNNQPGTYRCECAEGYQFAADGQTCVGEFHVSSKPCPPAFGLRSTSQGQKTVLHDLC